MKQQMKKIVIASSIIGALVIVTTAIIMRSKRKKLQAQIAKGSPDIVAPAKSTTTPTMFPLKRGSGSTVAERNAVKVVQRYINIKGVEHWWLQLTSLAEDGIFGAKTEAALLKFESVKVVSYNLYKEMQNFLSPAPDYLSPSASPYKEPQVVKNDLISTSPLTLFG